MNSDTALILIVVFGTVATGCTLAVLRARVLQRSLPRDAAGWAATSAAVVAVCLATAAPRNAATEPAPEHRTPRYSAPRYINDELSRMEMRRHEFAPALEAYRQAHGHYPPTLGAAGVEVPMTRYGPLHYYGSTERPAWYLVSFGDPTVNRFSADWDSRRQKWSVYLMDD